MIKPKNKIYRRQDCPKVYDLTTSGFVINVKSLYKYNDIFAGKVFGYKINKERAIDIDDYTDFKIAEFLKKNERIKR